MAMREGKKDKGDFAAKGQAFCSEYLALCTGQMRCKAMRPVVERELFAHMEEQRQAYLSEGKGEEEAGKLAVGQMGDPLETGMRLDRIHRPRMNWRAAGMILALAALGLFFQFMFSIKGGDGHALWNYVKSTSVGIVFMFGICFVDYTILGKYPRAVWCGMTALCMAATFWEPRLNGMVRSEYTLMLLVPCYAGLVFFYRGQKGLGVAKALAWLLAAGVCVLLAGPQASIGKVWLCGGFLMLGYAVFAGWYQVKKGMALLVWGLPVAGILVTPVMMIAEKGYRGERVLAFLNPQDRAGTAGSVYLRMQEIWQRLRLVGQAPISGEEDWWQYQTENMALLRIGETYGVLAAAALAALLVVFAVLLLRRLLRQSNRLGLLAGLGGVYVFAVTALLHVMISTGHFPVTSCALPFVSMNGKQNVCLFILMGILLSVFRNDTVRPEPGVSAGPVHRSASRRFLQGGRVCGYRKQS